MKMHMEQVYKQWNNDKKLGSSGIRKAGYHNGSYLLLLAYRKLQSCRISYE